jgi:hypothetical protein
VLAKYPLAHAVALYSRGVVIADINRFAGQDQQTYFCNAEATVAEFSTFIEKMLPEWQSNKPKLPAPDHPYADSIRVEIDRINEAYPKEEAAKMRQLLKELSV